MHIKCVLVDRCLRVCVRKCNRSPSHHPQNGINPDCDGDGYDDDEKQINAPTLAAVHCFVGDTTDVPMKSNTIII